MRAASDADLVLAAGNGNKEAFGALADRHTNRARRVAMRMVGNDDVACELVQEAVLQAYLGLSTLREPAYFGAWLIGIVQNLCRTHLRAQQRLSLTPDWPAEADLLADASLDPLTQLEEQERRDLVLQAIAALSPKNQVATWLYYIEAMSIDEVAQTLEVSPNAVKGRLFQARKQLHTMLGPIFTATYGITRLHPATEHNSKKKGKTMATISKVKVLRSSPTNNYVLYLFDTENQRYLCIWIGPYEGEQIRLQLSGLPTIRPMTYRYFADFLQTMEIQLESVIVARLHETTFYAVSRFRNGEVIKELDGRPSDAIGLALHTGSPILIDEELMAQHGKSLTDEEVDSDALSPLAKIDLERWFMNKIERVRREQLTVAGWNADLFEDEKTRFTTHARIALLNALGLAQFLHHNYVGTEHLIWGLTNHQEGGAAQLLHTVGVTSITLDQAATARLGSLPLTVEGRKLDAESADPTTPAPHLVPRVLQVLELAEAAKAETNAAQIDTEHLLLGILREGGGMAVTLLQDLSVDLAGLERQLLDT